jgi:hypothetical protein
MDLVHSSTDQLMAALPKRENFTGVIIYMPDAKGKPAQTGDQACVETSPWLNRLDVARILTDGVRVLLREIASGK